MSSKHRLLSHFSDVKTPVYGDTPMPVISPHKQLLRGDSCNTYSISINNHTGTHVDAPGHFIKDGKNISDYTLDELIFEKPMVVECPKDAGVWVELKDILPLEKHVVDADCIIFKTNFEGLREKDEYRTNNPGISPDAISWMRRVFPSIGCIGLDTISISGFQDRKRGRESHLAAFKKQKGLGKPLLVIEDMKLKPLLPGDRLKKIIVLPWQISVIDSAPCSVLAEVMSYE